MLICYKKALKEVLQEPIFYIIFSLFGIILLKRLPQEVEIVFIIIYGSFLKIKKK